jgi:putative FmdB family regulatory protein
MPIYEYVCEHCGGTSEFIEGLSDAGEQKTCGHCGALSLRRVLSKGVTSRMNGIIGDRGGKTCCGKDHSSGSPPCDAPGSCCR